MSELKIIQGVFKEELKNRFLCLVEINGEDVLCYIPSSCRLSNFTNLTGKTVLLTPITSANARTKYAVYALRVGKQYVLLNMSHTNKVIERNIHNRRFSFLGKRSNVRKEHVVEKYKSDLFIEDTHTVVEIKSILAFEKEAIFPTVYSQRAIDQLAKLNSLLDMGYQVCYLFVSLNPTVETLKINKEIDEYYRLFIECIGKGMLVKGFKVKMRDFEPVIYSKLNIVNVSAED